MRYHVQYVCYDGIDAVEGRAVLHRFFQGMEYNRFQAKLVNHASHVCSLALGIQE